MRKFTLAVAALGIVASLAPLSANADHCGRPVVMWGQPYGVQAAGLVCLADNGEDVDGRVFLPGTTGVSVGYTVSCTVPSAVTATLTGSLFPTPRTINLPCITLSAGGTRYESSAVSWTGGRTAVGCVTATVNVEEEEFPSTTYRTASATC